MEVNQNYIFWPPIDRIKIYITIQYNEEIAYAKLIKEVSSKISKLKWQKTISD